MEESKESRPILGIVRFYYPNNFLNLMKGSR